MSHGARPQPAQFLHYAGKWEDKPAPVALATQLYALARKTRPHLTPQTRASLPLPSPSRRRRRRQPRPPPPRPPQVNDRTAVDRALDAEARAGRVRRFKMSTGPDDYAVMLAADYVQEARPGCAIESRRALAASCPC